VESMLWSLVSLNQRGPLDSKWKKKTEATRAQLQLHLRSGEILDDIIRGYVLEGPPDTKANLLHGMVETSLPRTGPGNVSVHAAVVIPIQTSDSEKPP